MKVFAPTQIELMRQSFDALNRGPSPSVRILEWAPGSGDRLLDEYMPTTEELEAACSSSNPTNR
jgi:hypothetical protein